MGSAISACCDNSKPEESSANKTQLTSKPLPK